METNHFCAMNQTNDKRVRFRYKRWSMESRRDWWLLVIVRKLYKGYFVSERSNTGLLDNEQIRQNII